MIVNGLENYQPFKMLMEDFQKNLEIADGTWHLVKQDEMWKFWELKCTKLAAASILHVIDNYKAELNKAKQALEEIRNPEEIQSGYYDGETNYEQEG